jgi:chemotaxis protein MotB
MKRFSTHAGLILALTAMVLLPACDSGKDMQITELQRQVDDLKAKNNDLESRLGAALSGADQAKQAALALQQQLDDARRQLAERGGTPGVEGEWSEFGQVAWISVSGDFLFDSGKDTLKGNAGAKLQEIAGVIKSKYPNRRILIVGHTDNDPIMKTKNLWKDNLDLSLNRAATVARELYKMGLNSKKLYVAGQGEHAPKGPNDTKENKSLNRRVEIVCIEQ